VCSERRTGRNERAFTAEREKSLVPLETGYGGRDAYELREDIITFIVLAETADVPREQRDRFMHKKEETPGDNTNWTPLTAQVRCTDYMGHR